MRAQVIKKLKKWSYQAHTDNVPMYEAVKKIETTANSVVMVLLVNHGCCDGWLRLAAFFMVFGKTEVAEIFLIALFVCLLVYDIIVYKRSTDLNSNDWTGTVFDAYDYQPEELARTQVDYHILTICANYLLCVPDSGPHILRSLCFSAIFVCD